MLKELKEIVTKTGKKMAFGSVEDPRGSIEIVVFADALERWRDKLVVDSVIFARGKIDLSRGNPSLKIDELVDPASLKEKSWREIHFRLLKAPASEDELYELRDAIFDEPGPCGVFFHVPSGSKGEAVVKAHVQIPCSASEEALERLRSVSPVAEIWRN